jgi:hypothetical protein
MSTMTYTTTTRRIVRAEWTKLRTLPSTWRTAVLTMVMAVGFGVAVAFSEAGQRHTMTAQQRQVFDPASASMVGVMIAAVVLGALAACRRPRGRLGPGRKGETTVRSAEKISYFPNGRWCHGPASARPPRRPSPRARCAAGGPSQTVPTGEHYRGHVLAQR